MELCMTVLLKPDMCNYDVHSTFVIITDVYKTLYFYYIILCQITQTNLQFLGEL